MRNFIGIVLKSLFKASFAIPIILIIGAFINDSVPIVMIILITLAIFITFVLESIIIPHLNIKENVAKMAFRHFFYPLVIGLLIGAFLLLLQYIPAPFSNLEVNIRPAFQSIGQPPASKPDIKNIPQLIRQPDIQILSHYLLDFSPMHFFILILLIASVILPRFTALTLRAEFLLGMIVTGIITNILSTGWFGVILSVSGIIIPWLILFLVSLFNVRMVAGIYLLTITLGSVMGLPFILATLILSVIVLYIISQYYHHTQNRNGWLIRFFAEPDPDFPEHPVYNSGIIMITGAFTTLIGLILINLHRFPKFSFLNKII
jgi:hypothetical protein